MNEQTTKLLEQLANKLGTTSEYLWAVLLRQAPIEATIQLLQTLLIVAAAFYLIKLHKKFSTKPPDDVYDDYYEKYDLSIKVPMVVATIVIGIALIAGFCCIENIISGYINPEFWALNNVLNSLQGR